MHPKPRPLANFVTVLLLALGSAHASTIGVFFNTDGSDCDLAQSAPGPITWYVIAHLGGDAAADGITGAEFRHGGTPAGWFVNPLPNPAANVNLIHPAGYGVGLNIAFPSCQVGSGGMLIL